MSSVVLDAKLFQKRCRSLMSALRTSDCESFLFTIGSTSVENKTIALHMWLFGYQLTDTIMSLTQDGVILMSSQKKVKILETLIKSDNKINIRVLVKNKGENQETIEEFLSFMTKNGKKCGSLIKEKSESKFMDEWNSVVSQANLETVDIASIVGKCMAVKDEDELKSHKIAAKLSNQVLKKFVIDEIEDILDQEKSVTHYEFSKKIAQSIESEKARQKMHFPTDLEIQSLDWAFEPVIQSGGNYDVRVGVTSNKDKLDAGVIVSSFGLRYENYTSFIARTWLIDPDKSVEKNYKVLLEAFDLAAATIKDGTVLKDVYTKVVNFLTNKKPDLVDHLGKNAGFVLGLELRDATMLISGKNNNDFKSGMVVNLAISLTNLKDNKNKIYTLYVADTYLVTDTTPLPLTTVTKALSEISYTFKDDEEKEDDKENGDVQITKSEKSNDSLVSAPSHVQLKSALIASKTRSEERDELSSEQKRRIHQKQLAEAKQKEGLDRFADGIEQIEKEKLVFRRFDSYKKDTQLPKQTKDLRIIVDRKSDSIILPIYGFAVPFHILTIKNVTKSEESDYVHIRFNFITPGQTLGKKEATPFEDANATFIRTIAFRSADAYRMNEIFKEVNDLRKDVLKREAELRERSDLVAQDNLIELKGKRPPRLSDAYARPALEGKRSTGELEIHINGLRYYTSVRTDQKIDILFSNIKHIFFQPCDGEMLVLIHIHLKNSIMIGKKKTRDVQFYKEVTDAMFDETGNRRRRMNYGDEDELEAEHEERKKRAELNRDFKTFAERISEMSKNAFEVDIPFRELGFNGVPFRQLVLMQPTSTCLVHLTEPPFLVIDLSEVEIVHLERVQFGLKNFDMVFVFKDFSKPVVHINTIPTKDLDSVKEWLDSVDLCFTEGPVNLNWTQIMKTVNEDPAAFFEEGGWSFLQIESDNEDDDMSDSASEFEAVSDADEESSDFSESEDEYDSDASGSDFSEEDADSEAADWDELEEEAARSDARNANKRGVEEDFKSSKKKARR